MRWVGWVSIFVYISNAILQARAYRMIESNLSWVSKKPVSWMGSGSFVDSNFFVREYYFLWNSAAAQIWDAVQLQTWLVTWNCIQCFDIWAAAHLKPGFGGGSAKRFKFGLFLKLKPTQMYRSQSVYQGNIQHEPTSFSRVKIIHFYIPVVNLVMEVTSFV